MCSSLLRTNLWMEIWKPAYSLVVNQPECPSRPDPCWISPLSRLCSLLQTHRPSFLRVLGKDRSVSFLRAFAHAFSPGPAHFPSPSSPNQGLIKSSSSLRLDVCLGFSGGRHFFLQIWVFVWYNFSSTSHTLFFGVNLPPISKCPYFIFMVWSVVLPEEFEVDSFLFRVLMYVILCLMASIVWNKVSCHSSYCYLNVMSLFCGGLRTLLLNLILLIWWWWT